MVACDNKSCTTVRFHMDFLMLQVPSKGKWYCPHCRKLPVFEIEETEVRVRNKYKAAYWRVTLVYMYMYYLRVNLTLNGEIMLSPKALYSLGVTKTLSVNCSLSVIINRVVIRGKPVHSNPNSGISWPPSCHSCRLCAVLAHLKHNMGQPESPNIVSIIVL